MKIRYALLSACLCALHVCAQQNNATFGPPFDFPLSLSGNFGEIRSNHFHGGLDFKTQGVSGKKVLAIADGYISRIRVTHGSGYVLDVCYDNGYSTINRHLSGFVSPIAERVKALQYEKESYEVTIIPEPNEYRVKKGEHIAFSGNTGYSFAPHLHLDMFETVSDDYVDPLPFFKDKLKDTRQPQVVGYMLFPQIGKGIVNRKAEPQQFAPNHKDTIKAWGEIGAAIRAYDYMDGTTNKYGVHTVVLTVDGQEVFRSVVDRFSDAENRMINSWTYKEYMKSFIEPNNKLRILKAGNDNRGLVTIDEERPYRFKYTLSDAYGNTTSFSFTVVGSPGDIPQTPHESDVMFLHNKDSYFEKPGLSLFVPKGVLYDDVALDYTTKDYDDRTVSWVYILNREPIPMHDYAHLLIAFHPLEGVDPSKYYAAKINKNNKLSSLGGTFKDGIMRVKIRELTTFAVAVDTIPPTVTPVNPQAWAKNGKITYKIKDEQTGIRSYRGTIDGEYALFGLNIMNNNVVYTIDPKRVKRGVAHTVEMTVVDECGNQTIVRNKFTY